MAIDNALTDLSPEERELLLLLLKKEGLDPLRLPIPRRQGDDDAPLSFAQERFWFLQQFDPDNPAYNIPIALRLAGSLDLAALELSLDEIVQRHDVLRAAFVDQAGVPRQVVAPRRPVALEVIDLQALPSEARRDEALRRATEAARRPFDTERDALLRAFVLRLAADEHLFVLIAHHLIFDGWSLILFMRELGERYTAQVTGVPAALPGLPIQYADFAAWQRQFMQGEALKPDLDYWRQRLADAPAELELPSDRPHPPVRTYGGAVRPFSLPATLSEELRRLAQRQGTTLYITLLAAFQTLLHRYTGQDDILVGTAVSTRSRAETESLIGSFANNLCLRADLSGDPSFEEALTRAHEAVLEALAHQELPFEQLLDAMQPKRSLSHTPLFQAMFVLHERPLEECLSLPGVAVARVPIDLGTARFDLSLDMSDGRQGLSGALEYNTDIFDDATIERLLTHFRVLLEGIVADPARRLSALPLLTADERQAMLVEWNATSLALPPRPFVHELVAAQAERTPDATAVEFDGDRLTYRELDRRSNQVAAHLACSGVAPGVLVGVCVERSLAMVVALLGVLKSGGAYVPLDPSFPRDRLAFMLADSRAPVLVTQARLRDALPPTTARIVDLDADRPAIDREAGDPIDPAVQPDDLAYVLYTSGSTGQPKGVTITHRNLVNFLLAMRREPGLTADDAVLAITTLSFDIAGLELYLPLIVGARVVIASRATASDGLALIDLIDQSGVTVMQATPATWRLLLEAGWQGRPGLTILCGGEALPRPLAQELLARGAAVWNLYGPTETTIWSTICRVRDEAGPVSIGRPIANTILYVLDAHRNPVPVGVPGELYIGGDGVARGYLNRPDLTDERFVPDPFRAEPGARIYKTGDRARYRPDGQVDYLGRLDHQVKVRGFRIELGEIEALLVQHPAVQRAAVIVREDVPGNPRLVAYVVPEPPADDAGDGATASDDDPEGRWRALLPALREQLAAALPDYMTPAAYVRLEALPLTPNGKLNRQALPSPDPARPGDDDGFVPPRDDTERRLAELWGMVLGVEAVGVTDDFFELGGQSLLAARLFALIQREFDQRLPLATLFQAPTIEHLARLLRRDAAPAGWSSLAPLRPHGSKAPFYCVHGAGGNVLNFRSLGPHLHPEQPFYTLQAQGLDGEQALHSRIEEMAAHYLREIRTVQPAGPYSLGGYCAGGLVAWEMARQLRADGQEVAFLALLDTMAPEHQSSFGYWKNWYLRRGRMHLANLSRQAPSRMLRYVLGRLRTVGWRIGSFTRTRKWQSTYLAHQRAGQPLSPELRDHMEMAKFATQRYKPAVAETPVTLFVARERGVDIDADPLFGWGGLARRGLTIIETPGDHHTIFDEPHVQTLAARLQECLDAARPS
jgi:amino acid adenylation domain-containing protein